MHVSASSSDIYSFFSMCCTWHFPSRVVLKFDLNYNIMVRRGQDIPMIGKYFLLRYLPDLSALPFPPARESLPLSSHKGGRVGRIWRFSQYRRNWGANSLKRTYQNILLTDRRALRLPCQSNFNVWHFPECVPPQNSVLLLIPCCVCSGMRGGSI